MLETLRKPQVKGETRPCFNKIPSSSSSVVMTEDIHRKEVASEQALLATGMELFKSSLLDSEITSILSAIVANESYSVKKKMQHIGWNENQFTRTFTLDEFKACFASTITEPMKKTVSSSRPTNPYSGCTKIVH